MDLTPANSIRVYADTSVFGGYFDAVFEEASRAFFHMVKAGEYKLVVSSVVSDELLDAPQKVWNLFVEMADYIDVVEINQAALLLQSAYLDAHIVGPRWDADALHVAIASVSSCRAIVSWNCKHIVNFRRIPLYNGINMVHGYTSIGIHTPEEMLAYEDEE